MIVNDSVYGKIELDFLLEKIVQTQPMQRLKNIHQNGVMFLAHPEMKTSRFEHSLGVCHLVKILGGDRKEQIAGLLHDLSHTAFSHVIDYVIENKEEDFHEQHKRRFLLERELAETLHDLGFESEDFLDDRGFHILEAEHPDLCADRIDYTLRDLIAWGKISEPEVREFLKSLVFVRGKIAIDSILWGRWFKDRYLYLNDCFYREPKYVFVNTQFCQLLKKALLLNAIRLEDFFGDDDFVIDKMIANPILQEDLTVIQAQLKQFKSYEDRSFNTEFKKRSVDPPIVQNNRVTRLSECI